jgi:DNA-binding NtrC family response regulator
MTPGVLILHCDRNVAEAGRDVLNSSGFSSIVVSCVEEALAVLESHSPHLLLLDPNAASTDPSRFQSACGGPVVAVATFNTLEAAVSVLKESASARLSERAISSPKLLLQSLNSRPAMQLPMSGWLGVVGESQALNQSMEMAQKAGRSAANILLYGESGTGKELAARAIHCNSSRAAGAFVAVDCASLPESLLEAELFGYEKGAFTGAIATKPGLMELAHLGTLFLDEVGELPVSLQAKLLRALQENEHRRVGGTKNVKFDMRLVAATNRDLHRGVKEGTFREDLLFRLNVIPIRLPPLRERGDDVTLLANYFLEKFAEIDTGMIKIFDPEVLHFFQLYPWPGNIRELQNVVRRMCIVAEGSLITMRDLPEELLPSESEGVPRLAANSGMESSKLTFMEAKRRCLKLFEAAYAERVLNRCAGNVSRAAEAADVDRKTFYRLLRKHQLEPEVYRA